MIGKVSVMVAEKLEIVFNKILLEDFITGLNVELEYGLKSSTTNDADDDLEILLKFTHKFK